MKDLETVADRETEREKEREREREIQREREGAIKPITDKHVCLNKSMKKEN